MKVNKGFVRKAICVVCVLVMLLSLFAGAISASAAEVEMPTIARWVNGMAIDENEEYLSDCWALDETGVSDRKYVFLGENYEEVMRVAKYPDDVDNGDTTICQKHSLNFSLDVPEGVSGDVLVALENEHVAYTFVASENNGYSLSEAVYPGRYRIAEIRVMSDVDGSYKVKNVDEINVDAANYTAELLIVADEAGKVDDATEGVDGTEGGVADGNGGDAVKDNDLLYDTIKLGVAVLILLGILAFDKIRRQKSEEIRQ